jgi:hypothetical protein
VCVLVKTLSGSTSIKEAVFCNFVLAYLPVVSIPPTFPETWRITRRAGNSVLFNRDWEIFGGSKEAWA